MHKTFKAMDQTGHVTRFLLYRRLSLCNHIYIKNMVDNCEFVESNKIHEYRSAWS